MMLVCKKLPASIHFLGIAGVAMAQMAVLLSELGVRVSGSDQNIYPPASDLLNERGISVSQGYHPKNIPNDVDLVVIGNALSRGNEEVEAVLGGRFRYVSLPELVKEICIRGKESIVVTGTHGKTTTTALLAWLLQHAGKDPSFFVGGVPLNFGRGFQFKDGEHIVVEGDEYDTAFFDKRPKFIHYLPNILIVNTVEFDHSDIYPDIQAIEKVFLQLVNIVPRNGLIVANGDCELVRQIVEKAHCTVKTFGVNDEVNWRVRNITCSEKGTRFELIHEGRCYGDFLIPILGKFNALNATSALVVTHHVGILQESALRALSLFKGVRRRMELIGNINGIRLYDDFAHHPTAIKGTLETLKQAYKKHRIWAVLEPRSNTMVRRFHQELLPRALSYADRVVLAPLHREDRIPISERLDVKKVVDELLKIGKVAHYFSDVKDILDLLIQEVMEGDVVVFMSNGGFHGIQKRFMKLLLNGGFQERH